ncbi:MAG: hypothetical protein M1812_001342 [Candelaria pacifica]|nr:MAG: hypothetical protein M1812_001342 [Candelaria pacifica]
MGKLNYTNRKVDGPKLGQIVEKDLLKRIPPKSGSNAAMRDPFVELNVVGKHLSDEGFLPVVNGLFAAYTYTQGSPILHLEELHLADNNLTARCLISLSAVIRLGAGDLQDIDLSHNNISVFSDDDVFAWESFLTALKDCSVLRRLNLSGNPLGPRAFEVLVRAYSREDSLDLSTSVGDDEGYRSSLEPSSCDEEEAPFGQKLKALTIDTEKTSQHSSSPVASTPRSQGSHKSSSTMGTPAQSTPSPCKPTKYITTRGIRSVPYIILSNTSMTDVCALHLSYILACHHPPGHLLARAPPAKAGPPSHQLEANGMHSGCQGIVYLPNESISSAGARLLEIAEYARGSLSEDSTIDVFTEEIAIRTSAARLRRASSVAGEGSVTGRASGRRCSTLSMTGIELAASSIDGTAIDAELERARSKIQGNTLKNLGMGSLDLWRITIKTLVLARAVLLRAGESNDTLSSGATRYATAITTSSVDSEPVLAITGVSPIPITPTVTYKSTKPSPGTTATQHSSPSLESNVRTSPLSVSIKIDEDDNDELLYGLNKNLWIRIITDITDPDGILSETQREAIIEWAMDTNTLNRERELLGKPEYIQIWRLLDGVGCLAYDVWA